ncbi:MAG: phosphonate ABC transporter, permease protein PhnE [Sneathiella sp.]|nr:MAG: phosphonate ABC transporter, permease protein PhnE [Sneathiella sp.]
MVVIYVFMATIGTRGVANYLAVFGIVEEGFKFGVVDRYLTGIDVNWSRIQRGMARGMQFIGGFFHPDFNTHWVDIKQGMYESVVMTIASTVVGIAISIPIALGAARNIAPLPVYLICRFIITISRALNELIVAIILVAILGFGPLAGFITLSFATIGFLAKLLAEEIEDMNKVQAEAVESTGANWLQRVNFGVQPQVMPRLIGLSMYRLDINFRESAVLGLVGAGGIGATLNTAFDRYEFSTVAAILLIIIGTVMVLEYLSGIIRARIK